MAKESSDERFVPTIHQPENQPIPNAYEIRNTSIFRTIPAHSPPSPSGAAPRRDRPGMCSARPSPSGDSRWQRPSLRPRASTPERCPNPSCWGCWAGAGSRNAHCCAHTRWVDVQMLFDADRWLGSWIDFCVCPQVRARPVAGHIGIADPRHYRAEIFDVFHIMAGQIGKEGLRLGVLVMHVAVDNAGGPGSSAGGGRSNRCGRHGFPQDGFVKATLCA